MKKTFKLTHEKIKPARLVEKFKYEVKKYVKRERRRSLPKTMDYWDFNCRYGADADSADLLPLLSVMLLLMWLVLLILLLIQLLIFSSCCC